MWVVLDFKASQARVQRPSEPDVTSYSSETPVAHRDIGDLVKVQALTYWCKMAWTGGQMAYSRLPQRLMQRAPAAFSLPSRSTAGPSYPPRWKPELPHPLRSKTGPSYSTRLKSELSHPFEQTRFSHPFEQTRFSSAQAKQAEAGMQNKWNGQKDNRARVNRFRGIVAPFLPAPLKELNTSYNTAQGMYTAGENINKNGRSAYGDARNIKKVKDPATMGKVADESLNAASSAVIIYNGVNTMKPVAKGAYSAFESGGGF
ncbi:hypothetical protein B7494_g5922 [Chlorociboria aeruginascens]|nr:hypothetical protein B7494_g5922 [Chlorociboria aeruginascens]